ncbi:Rieske (2Fe-2S) protein [Haloarculaceae archaeon H-GB11]|nr:Rieske (2Fe-2S) protein [Haloarculaceae archaeon H-GB11]
MATDDRFVEAADLESLRDEGRTLVSEGGRHIALFHHEDEVYAVDNRCPHMGFPLSDGTVDEGVLTCHWHHARFELSCGDTFDPWADDVQTFPVEVRDGMVYVDPDPEPDVPPETHWRNRLADGLQEDIPLVMAKAIIGLDAAGVDYSVPLGTVVDFGTTYRRAGWGSGLTIATAMANVLDDFDAADRRRALFTGARHVADDCAGEPPRFPQHPLSTTSVSKDRLKKWLRDAVEVRDSDAAERTLRAAVAHLDAADVAELLVAAATDSIFLDTGHTFDFLNKAFEVLDHVGASEREESDPDRMADVLASTVESLTDATRSEELSSWRQPIDLAALRFAFEDDLPDLRANGDADSWDRPEDFVETLLSDDPHDIDDAIRSAVRDGATPADLATPVTTAAMRRVVQFSTANEFSDWNTVHHTFTYANAVEEMARRTDADELYRAVYDGAMRVYLNRFLNMPSAPIPEPSETDRDPETIRAALLETFDVEGEVDRATKLAGEYLDAGGDPAVLMESLGHALLREDAGFHTLQAVEAGFRQFDRSDSETRRRLAVLAPTRYMAAHFPTRRENEQTFTIAARLHRGERIHEN